MDAVNASGTKDHEYVLGRDYLGAARLNLQHYLLVEDVGYHVHPAITLRPGMKVADVATGTGIWMMDLAPQNPEVSFHGFDVDLAPAPPKEWLPSNVKLDEMDLFQPAPEEYIGHFDYIHTRLLMCVIPQDSGPISDNLIKLLKPGGILQWVEMDHPTHRFDKARSEHDYTFLEQAGTFPSTLGSEDSRMDPRWVGKLASYFRGHGLQVLADDHKYREPHHLVYYCDQAFMAWEEWRSKMKFDDAVKYGEILEKAKREVHEAKRGVSINMEIRTVVGRKPH